MRLSGCIFLFIVVSFSSCEESLESSIHDERDTIAPIMTLRGSERDTAHLYSRYSDPKVNVLDFIQGRLRCPDDGLSLEVLGYVDHEHPGVYTLTYTAQDKAGNKAPPLTRTVVVVPNPDAFLTGNYNVICTCTASLKGTGTPTVSATNYSVSIVPGETHKSFDLISMNIGAERVVQRLTRKSDTLYAGYFHSDYRHSESTGILDPSKNSFTIQTTYFKFTPPVIYKCRNVFTKQLILKANPEK
jgi:hypothetical protein